MRGWEMRIEWVTVYCAFLGDVDFAVGGVLWFVGPFSPSLRMLSLNWLKKSPVPTLYYCLTLFSGWMGWRECCLPLQTHWFSQECLVGRHYCYSPLPFLPFTLLPNLYFSVSTNHLPYLLTYLPMHQPTCFTNLLYWQLTPLKECPKLTA